MSVFRDGRISTHADPKSTRRTNSIGMRVTKPRSITWQQGPAGRFVFWGSKVPKNGRFVALAADEPQCKIWGR